MVSSKRSLPESGFSERRAKSLAGRIFLLRMRRLLNMAWSC